MTCMHAHLLQFLNENILHVRLACCCLIYHCLKNSSFSGIFILLFIFVAVTFQGSVDLQMHRCLSCLCCSRKMPKARYMHLAQELSVDPDWPPKPTTTTEAKSRPENGSTYHIMIDS